MMTYVFGGVAALFLLWTVAAFWHVRWVRRLPGWESLGTPARERTRVTVVIAARDEAARIEHTIGHLLDQRGIELDLIVVDDRSSDGTEQILERLADEDSRIQVKRIETLPEGWLGKCHACHLGASVAAGDWILFTDADCWLKPDVIARALRVAELEGADHITLASGLAEGSMGLRSAHLMFLISLASWFSGVNRDKKKAFMGIGAFNLVRASAYRQCGGYQALRLTVVDDMKLGLLLRRAGKRTRAFIGGDDVECHWGTRAWNMVGIMEKNYFAALDYRLGLVVAGTLCVAGVMAILILGLCSGSVLGLAAGGSPLLLVLPAALLARRLGWSWASALPVPFMLPFFWYTLLNSTFATLRRGGVRWRETFYPLESLRAGNVR